MACDAKESSHNQFPWYDRADGSSAEYSAAAPHINELSAALKRGSRDSYKAATAAAAALFR